MLAKIMIEVPANLKNLVKPVMDLISTAGSLMRSETGGRAVDYAETERQIAKKTAAVEQAVHQELLARLEVDRLRIVIKGKAYTRVAHGLGTYYTVSGPVEIRRALYREDGCRNGPTVDAISVRTGAIGRGWLPQTASAMAFLLQQGTSREGEQTAKQLGRLPYSRGSFERVSHELAELYVNQQADIEDEMIQELKIPEQACSASVAIDRVSVPMEEPGKRPVGRPRKDAPKHPVERNFRMAYCATLTLHDGKGGSLHTIRYGCMPKGDPELLCQGIAADLGRLLEKRPDLLVSALGDGAPENWNLMSPIRELGIKLHELVDFWHLAENLHAAAVVIHGEGQAGAVTGAWKRKLKRRSDAAASILAELQASGCEDKVSGKKRERPVHEAITYLSNQGSRMNYASARRKGLPIGSGNVEATCKTLVGLRMKRSGSRWKERTGEHVLQLRALALSDRYETAMEKLFATQRTSVREAA